MESRHGATSDSRLLGLSLPCGSHDAPSVQAINFNIDMRGLEPNDVPAKQGLKVGVGLYF